jgi:acetolactate synthase-1/2/3 large subunit
MNKTGAWLVRYALEQLGINHTFGIPGVQNAEIYDQLSQSDSITPHLVNHEMSAAFMADAVSRTHAGSIGAMVIVSGSSVTHSASGIGEALLAGVPMLIIAGSGHRDQVPQIDQEQIVKALTKAYFKIDAHKQIVETLFHAYSIATGDSPGPVFVEIPLHIQLLSADVDDPLPSHPAAPKTQKP